MPLLQFQQLSSQPTPSFWTALNTLKLDKLKLDDTEQPISAWLGEGKEVVDRESVGGEKRIGVAGSVGVGGGAFGEESER
jgi:ubiquitin-like modifier-activating enzyme ATG7